MRPGSTGFCPAQTFNEQEEIVTRLWRQIIKGEEGQALPIVLILLVIGGLIIAPTLNHVSTSLNAGRIVEENVRGIYAAEAGVEEALWYLTQQLPESIPEQLPEDVNQMQVGIVPDPKGTYTLYFGELQEIGPQQNHYARLAVNGEMVWDEPADAYQYTITVTWQPPPPGTRDILLDDIGVRLPIGYSYQPGSAAVFIEDNFFDDDEPVDTLDWAGAQMLSWELQKPYPDPRPMVTEEYPEATQTFYVTGEGEQEGDYAWVKSGVSSIGELSDVIGTLYSITATATLPGDEEPIARVRADVILYEDEDEETAEISIVLWQINPEE